jgi:protein TonB
MFTHLIESGSHAKDIARRGRFFLGTLGFYGLLLSVAGVASVYAYDSHLGKQNLELYTLVAIPLPQQQQAQKPEEPQRPASGTHRPEVAQRVTAIARLLDNTQPPDIVSTERNRFAEIPRNAPYVISNRDIDPRDGGGGSVLNTPPGGTHLNTTNRKEVVVHVAPTDDPRPPVPTPTPAKPREQIRVSSQVISSKIISKPAPVYPMIAKQAGVQGPVTVEILVDEQGQVVAARATNGHPLLRMAAQQSAYRARFSPTTISGQPVKVSGVITYNFILQ